MTVSLRDLFMHTLRDPASAAEFLLGLGLGRRTLYTALLAGAALNALLTGLWVQAFGMGQNLPGVMTSPLAFFILAAGGLVLLSHLLTWAGRAMGGKGSLDDLMVLMVWLQLVRVTLQAGGFVLTIIAPLLGGLYGLFVAGLSLWIVLNFVKEGHRLASVGSAALVLVITFVGLIFGVAVLLGLLGVDPTGVSPNV